MRKVVTLFLVLSSIVALSLAYFYWPKIERRYKKMTLDKSQEAKDIARTKELLSNAKPEEALAIIQKYGDEVDNRSEEGREWLDLLIRASEATLNTPQLLVLYEYYPKAFDGHEKAAILIANTFVASGRTKDYQVLRDNWKGRETLPETWFVLDGDKLLAEGKRKEAIDFLNSKNFPGKADTSRLVRLALFYIFEQPKQAWEYLDQAYQKDPENPEIRSYRAKLLETIGRPNLALIEYAGALQSDPNNLYLRDQLADFYLRNKQVPQALQIWQENLKSPSLDMIWIKTLFWNKVAQPVSFDWESTQPPHGKLDSLVEYLLSLKPDQFWDAAAYENVKDNSHYLKTQQVTYWLRLLQLLKDGKEKEAGDLIQFNPFQTISWNPQLENALKRIIAYRTTGHFVPDTNIGFEKKKEAAPTKPIVTAENVLLYTQLDGLSQAKTPVVPEDLQALLKGPEAYTAALLSTGWNEAALKLHNLSVIPADYPEWFAPELTQAIRLNRGLPQALEFATLQNSTPQLSLLLGELLVASQSPDAALERLTKLMHDDTDVGMRAAWLVSMINIERGNYAEAKAAIEAQPKLENDTVGQETLARIALLEGNTDLANKLYSALEEKSAEAKSYLARKAFAEKDWKRAKELTEQLLRLYPTNPLLQENLKKINNEQGR